MPYSSISGKAFTARLLHNLSLRYTFKTILDIGVGSGTYSNLYRNRLNPYTNFLHEIWTGVEVWKPYIEMFDLGSKYDHLILEDVRTVFDDGGGLVTEHRQRFSYDLAFIGDVLEHMTKDEAVTLFAQVTSCSKYTIISIPIVHYPQDEYLGNPYEKHVKDDWSHDEVVQTFGEPATYIVDGEIGVYFYISSLFTGFADIAALDFIKRCGHGPMIAAYGIIKNESKHAREFISNLLVSGVDQIVICDTGSADDTLNIMTDYGRYHQSVLIPSITVQPWRFDQARNTALSFVSPYIDICISIDADEQLAPNFISNLKNVWVTESHPTRIIHKFKTEWDADSNNYSEHYHERIHARSGYKWSLPVHEILEKYDGDQVIAWATDLLMIQRPDLTKPRSSYFELLKQSVVERPDVWKSWSFLAAEYSANGDLENAKASIATTLKNDDADKAYLHYQLATLLEAWGYRKDGIKELKLAIMENSTARELQVYLAEMLKRDSNHQHALLALKEALTITTQTTGYLYNQNVWNDDKMNALLTTYQNEI